MSELIDRQEAINAINHICPVDTDYDSTLLDRVDVRYALSDLPSAEPISQIKWERDTAIAQLKELGYGFGEKPRKGKWIPHSEISREYKETALVYVRYDYWFCDACGYRVDKGQPIYNFCPNCGTRMED